MYNLLFKFYCPQCGKIIKNVKLLKVQEYWTRTWGGQSKQDMVTP